MRNYKVFLASQSPRRRALLAYLFNDINVLKLSADEPAWDGYETSLAYLERCTNFKWERALKAFPLPATASLLLVADTIVVQGKTVYGKPANRADAVRILGELSGRSHIVYTGYRLGLLGQGTGLRESGFCFEKSELRFAKLTRSQISAYVRTGEPMDKAGAYGFQGKALPFVSRLSGSYNNVLGLPVEAIRECVERLEAQ